MVESLLFAIPFVAVILGIVFCVRADQVGKTRRRELEHLERMAMIDKGLSFDDREIARLNALGAIGVAVPISGFVGGAIATMGTMTIEDLVFQLMTNVMLWIIIGTVCLVTIISIRSKLTETSESVRQDPSDK